MSGFLGYNDAIFILSYFILAIEIRWDLKLFTVVRQLVPKKGSGN